MQVYSHRVLVSRTRDVLDHVWDANYSGRETTRGLTRETQQAVHGTNIVLLAWHVASGPRKGHGQSLNIRIVGAHTGLWANQADCHDDRV